MRPDKGREGASFKIGMAPTALPGTTRAEPVLAGVPASGELDEVARLDPNRATPERDRPPARWERGLSLAVVGSLGVHLLPLLLLLDWTMIPAEIAAPIPVQLVIEEPPPPPPPPKPEEFKPPPPGRLASEDIGQTASPPPEAAVATPPAPSQPTATQMAAVVPPPSQPASTPIAAAVPPALKPIRPPKPAVPAFTWHRLDVIPQNAPRETRMPGPAATRDEYLAYCMLLIRRHFGLLSPSFLAGRRGAAAFKLLVLDDGRIARITIVQGSPYPDIDARIEEAVTAVRRFPPLPQWLQGSSAGLILQVIYPDGL